MAKHPKESQYKRPIGLLEAIQADYFLSRYHDLVLLQNFSHIYSDTERTRLKKKYHKMFPDNHPLPSSELIRKEISKLTARVNNILERVNAPTRWSSESEEFEYDFDKHRNMPVKNKDDFNVVLDRQYPQYRNYLGSNDIEITIPMLEESIGFYKFIWKRYWMRLINPLYWISFILRLPISLMEHMGVNTETERINKFIYWLIQALMLLILTFIAVKLGINVNFPLIRWGNVP